MLYNQDPMAPTLLVNFAKSFGGATVRIMDTVRGLASCRPYGVAVLTDSPLHNLLTEEGLTSYPLPYLRGDPRLAFSIARLIRQHGFTVIDTHNPQSALWGMIGLKLAGRGHLITTVHSSRDSTVSSAKTFLYDNVLRINKLAGSHFIAVSESVNSYLLDLGIEQKKVTVIPNGIRLMPGSSDSPRHSFRNSVGWSRHHKVIVIVGRLEAIKGHRFFLDALPTILLKNPQVRCLIAGTGRLENKLKAQVKRLNLEGFVHFAGFRNDINTLLDESDIFCMPSLSEGLPFALLEACARHLPALCTNVGGVGEFMVDG